MVATQLHSAEDLRELERDGQHYELIEGELIAVMSPSPKHAMVVANLTSMLWNLISVPGAGQILAGDPMILCATDPDTVLGPDIAVVGRGRLPPDDSAFMTIPPDWGIKVVSPGNSPGEIERKVAIYLRFGVQRVWVVYPREKQVVIHLPAGAPQLFDAQATVAGIEPFPGVEIVVSAIFGE